MNANELADGIENCTTDLLHKEAATMLRQQQARVTELEGCLEDCYKVQKMQADELYKGNAEIETLKSVVLALDSSIDNAKACMRMSAEELMELYK